MYPVYKNIGTKENCEIVKINFPPQHQDCHPGLEYLMNPRPISDNVNYKGSNKLLDKVAIITGGDSGIGRAVAYAYAKEGVIVAFTRSLSKSLIKEGIRVNAVAPGPIWTPIIPSSFSSQEVETFGSLRSQVSMDRAGQPFEVATSYVFLASDDSSYMSGQVLHVNGGNIV